MSAHAGGAWFAPKAYGYGAGLPIAWQGWVLLAALILSVTSAAVFLRGWRRLVVIGSITILATAIAYWTTDGGWHWRSG